MESWDITKLLGPQKWTYFYLYVILDVFSRFAARRKTAEDVDDEREIADAFPGSDIREIAHPQAIRLTSGEVALDEIPGPRCSGICLGDPPRLPAPLGPDDPVRGHQPLDLAARDPLPGPQQRLPRPPVPIGRIVALVRGPDHLEQPPVEPVQRSPVARW